MTSPFLTQRWHVVPIDDLREHEDSAQCWCRPEPHGDTDAVWVHRAMDGREAFETGERRVS